MPPIRTRRSDYIQDFDKQVRKMWDKSFEDAGGDTGGFEFVGYRINDENQVEVFAFDESGEFSSTEPVFTFDLDEVLKIEI